MERKLMRFVPGRHRESFRRNSRELRQFQEALDEAVEAQIRGQRLPVNPHDSDGSIANSASFIRNGFESGIAKQKLLPGFSARRSFQVNGNEVFLYNSLNDINVSTDGSSGRSVSAPGDIVNEDLERLLIQSFFVRLPVLEYESVIVEFKPLFEGRGIRGPVPEAVIMQRYGNELKAKPAIVRRAVDVVGAMRDASRYSR